MDLDDFDDKAFGKTDADDVYTAFITVMTSLKSVADRGIEAAKMHSNDSVATEVQIITQKAAGLAKLLSLSMFQNTKKDDDDDSITSFKTSAEDITKAVDILHEINAANTNLTYNDVCKDIKKKDENKKDDIDW